MKNASSKFYVHTNSHKYYDILFVYKQLALIEILNTKSLLHQIIDGKNI